jgi:hypothetical protein
VAEQRALDESFGEGRAIQLDERTVAPVARVVDGASEQLLARSRFPLEENRGAGRGGGRHGLEQPLDLDALADDRALAPELHHLAAQGVVLAAEPHDLECLSHGQLELLRPHWLGDVVHRAGLDRRDGVLDRRVAGEHDQRDVVALLLQQLEELEPRQPGHPIVRDDQVDVPLRERLERFGDAVRADGRMARPLERILENEPDRGLIVHVQDGGHVRAWGVRPEDGGEEYCRDVSM